MKKRMSGITTLGAALIAALVTLAAVGQQAAPKPQSAADVLRGVSKNSEEIEQLLSNLHSPNPSVRVATFSAMVDSNNPALVTLAINDAHTSADATMRDLAMRAALRQVQSIGFEPAGDQDHLPDQFENFSHRDLRPKILKYDPVLGMIQFTAGDGLISGTTFTFQNGYCKGNLTAVPGTWTYEGPVICANPQRETMRAKLKITIH